tara:strand:+ start:377 stop:784 length:408 start_codon:yes stop_codon:yes gene_type:complete
VKLKNKEISLARECSIKIIYQHLITAESNKSIYKNFHEKRPYNRTYLDKIIEIFDKRSQTIKSTLSKHTDIDVKQITKIDSSILYLAILEFLFLKEIPKKVIINEAIILAKKYSSEDSFKFVNKILDKISEKVRK